MYSVTQSISQYTAAELLVCLVVIFGLANDDVPTYLMLQFLSYFCTPAFCSTSLLVYVGIHITH